MRRRTVRAPRLSKWQRRQSAPAERADQAARQDLAASRSPHWCRAGNASAKQFIELRPLLFRRFFLCRLNEILIDMTGDGVKPTPVIGKRLKDDSVAMA